MINSIGRVGFLFTKSHHKNKDLRRIDNRYHKSTECVIRENPTENLTTPTATKTIPRL